MILPVMESDAFHLRAMVSVVDADIKQIVWVGNVLWQFDAQEFQRGDMTENLPRFCTLNDSCTLFERLLCDGSPLFAVDTGAHLICVNGMWAALVGKSYGQYLEIANENVEK
jgi:hypothetical protein